MTVDIDEIDVDKLREDLYDFFTGAYFNVSPVALMDMTKVETASDEEIIRIAIANRFDLNRYLKQYRR